MKKIIPIIITSGLTCFGAFYGANMQLPISTSLRPAKTGAEEKQQGIQGALESIYSMRLNEQTGTIEPEWVQSAIAQADRLTVSKRLNKAINWEAMGPDNVGGRTRAFQIHKTKPNIWFVGSVSGGLFRSSTNGQSWLPVNDQQENLSVTCIAQTIDGNIYYGTGEGGFTNLSGNRNGSPAFVGAGIFKSTDSEGTAFNLMPTAKDNRFFTCNSMVAHPTVNKMYVATEGGLYEFDFTGATEKITRIANGAFKEVKTDINGVIWASTSAGAVYKSDATGKLTITNTGYNSGGRTAIAISPDDPNYVYTLGAGSGNNYGKLVALYRTKNGGTTWEILVNGNSVTDIFGSNAQGWYDNAVSVKPGDKNFVVLGGVALATWDEINGYKEIASQFDAPWNNGYVHADKHLVEWDTRTKPATCIIGCDGGLYSSKDLGTWTSINRGFTTLQLYNVAANEKGHVAGGSQDNGTQLLNFTGNSFNGKPSQTAISIYGGDGFDVEFSKFNPSIVFMCTYYGNVARTGNLGQSSSTFWDKRQTGAVRSDFNTTFNLWEKSATESRLFLAKDHQVWVAINPTNFINPQVDWFLITKSLGNSRIIEMDYTADGDHLFVAKPGALYRIDSLNSAEFTVASNPLPANIPAKITTKLLSIPSISGRTITSVNVDQSDDNHVVITLGGYGNSRYVMESNDALADNPVWTDITGNLPSMPVYDAVIDVDNPNRIVLGTDLGVWVTENGGTNWEEANNGLARVPVFEIRGYEWRPWEGMTMYIGTHGRGYFKSTNLLTSNKKITKDNTTLKMNVYPNPTVSGSEVTFTSTTQTTGILEVYSLDGKKVYSDKIVATVGMNSVKLNSTNLKSGYHLVRVQLTNGSSQTVKLMVK